jgi:hypothetical protein
MKHVFIDTNIFMEFRAFDLDWCGLVGTAEVKLLVSGIVLSELDNHKTGDNERKRRRAETALRRLHQILFVSGGASIRAGVSLEAVVDDPSVSVDFDANRLSHRSNDDQLLATMLAYKSSLPQADICLASDDMGIKLKAHARNFPCVDVPPELRLPPEPDERDVELRKLRDELLRLQARIPKPQLAFVGGGQVAAVKITKAKKRTDYELRTAFDEIRRKLVVAPHISSGGLIAHELFVEPEEKAKYRDELREFDRELHLFLEKQDAYALAKSLIFSLQLEVANPGTASADDIDVEIIFPQGMDAQSERTLKEPREPRAPRNPSSVRLFHEASSIPDNMLELLALPIQLREDRRGSIYFRDEGPTHGVRIHVKRVKAGETVKLPLFEGWFEQSDAVGNFNFQYRILCATLSSPVEGRLGVKVDVDESRLRILTSSNRPQAIH